jgi:hypothetical protein
MRLPREQEPGQYDRDTAASAVLVVHQTVAVELEMAGFRRHGGRQTGFTR